MTTTDRPAVKIQRVVDETALYCHYEGQTEQQGCYLALDLETGELCCGYDPQIGGGMTKSEFDNRVLSHKIPCLTAEAANKLMAEVAPLAQRVVNGASVDWDGQNWVGVLDPAAQAAHDEMTLTIEQWCNDPGISTVDAIDAADWYSNGDDPTAELRITAATTDEQLREIAERAEQEIKDTAEGVVVVRNLAHYLTGLRDDARDAAG